MHISFALQLCCSGFKCLKQASIKIKFQWDHHATDLISSFATKHTLTSGASSSSCHDSSLQNHGTKYTAKLVKWKLLSWLNQTSSSAGPPKALQRSEGPHHALMPLELRDFVFWEYQPKPLTCIWTCLFWADYLRLFSLSHASLPPLACIRYLIVCLVKPKDEPCVCTYY